LKGAKPVKEHRIGFSRLVPFALFSNDMHQYRAMQLFYVFEGVNKVVYAVTENGTHILKAKLLKDKAGDKDAFDELLGMLGYAVHGFTDAGNALQDGFSIFAHGIVGLAGDDP
jgi:hypothetical protein